MTTQYKTSNILKINLDTISLSEANDLIEQLTDVAQERREKNRMDAMADIEAIAAKAGMTARQLMFGFSKTVKGASGPAIYRNPDNPTQTWSGQGRRPFWFDVTHPERYEVMSPAE